MKDKRRNFFKRNPPGLSQLFRLGKLHEIQGPGLFRNLSSRIDSTSKQTSRQHPSYLGIHIDPALGQECSHRLQRDLIALG